MLELAHDASRKGWRNHPCSVWVRKSIENYRWLSSLTYYLCLEYTYRYGKIHKFQNRVEWLRNNEPDLPSIQMTEFHLGMPDAYKTSCPVTSYRKYYINEKSYFAKWKTRPIPLWFLKCQSNR